MHHDSSQSIALFYTPELKRNLRHLSKKYPHIRTDIQPILDALAKGQLLGDKIPGVALDVYKVRAKNSDARKGKSGGYRIIYQVVNAKEIVLITVYLKTEQSDISAKAIRDIIVEFEKHAK